ncbi:hypothetical protein DPX16_16439 [Anabarilius grahami]|uniref:Uncharacterized protein n=1 Tax=Anabarilius grahami TaxID=495550 RepID=A0A3N0XXJ9_ANAGA|nr:hypothetical protein DPX16_16439 [Anabarilius grahami]
MQATGEPYHPNEVVLWFSCLVAMEWPENLSSETSQLTERGEDGLLRLLQLEQKCQEESPFGFATTLPNLVRADFSLTWQSQSIVLAFKQQVIEMLHGTHRRS